MLLVPFGKWFAKPSEHFSHEVATVNEEFLSILAKTTPIIAPAGRPYWLSAAKKRSQSIAAAQPAPAAVMAWR